MTTHVQTMIAVLWIVLVLVLAVSALWRRARTRRLRHQFGPEYDRTLARHASRAGAERELRERERQVRAHYHALFDDLLAPDASGTPPAPDRGPGLAGRSGGPAHTVGRPATRGRLRPTTPLIPRHRRR